MKPLNRDIHILEHIVSYCQQIEETVARFGNDGSIFYSDPIYRNAAALCILQIGELVGKLSEEFRSQHSSIPWRQIKAMRNIVAHSYGTVDPETTWEVIQYDIPKLKKYCAKRSVSKLAHAKSRKPTLLKYIIRVPLGYVLLVHGFGLSRQNQQAAAGVQELLHCL